MREPSPPYGHVTWRDAGDDVEHDAAAEVTVLAETVMGREQESSHFPGASTYLVKIARYPLWATSVRALVGAALLPIPVFLWAGTRYHYFRHAGSGYRVDQSAVLSGVTVALAGALVGAMVGALWGWLVVRHARRHVQAQ